jgi:hypothetical protein
MNQMVKFGKSAASWAHRQVQKVKGAALALVGVGASMVVGAKQAMAQTATLASTATSKLTSAEGDITSILVILIGVVFLFVLYGLIKKAK